MVITDTKNTFIKDGVEDEGRNFLKIISYVFSFTREYLRYHTPVHVKLIGPPRKYNIYNKLLISNLKLFDYDIVKINVKDEYTDAEGKAHEGLSTLMRYKLS